MRIAIVAQGTRGDVQPFTALGRGLKEVGFEVLIVTGQSFETLVCGRGLEFWPMEGDMEGAAQSEEVRALIDKGNPLAILSYMSKRTEEVNRQWTADGLRAAEGADLILGGVGGLVTGFSIAEKLGIPFIQAYLQPLTPTRDFPGFVAPTLPHWPGGFPYYLSHLVGQQMIWQMFRTSANKARREILGLSKLPFFGPFGSLARKRYPVLYGISPHVLPRPADWPDFVHMMGYWFLDSDAAWTPPADLVDFVRSGPPPVYIGFGSMASRDPEATAQLALDALKLSGRRGVLLSGWGGMSKADLPDSVFMAESVPHDWLFPQMAAVAHHGGAGTTAAGLRAGVPSVVIPFNVDQPFWGWQVAKLGVGPKPIPRKRLTAENLAQAITAAVSDEGMRQRAADLGAKIRAEDGVGRAAEIVRRFAENAGPAQ